MARLSEESLNKIKDKYNVDRLWSYSRVSTFKTSTYEYYLKYVKHMEEDRTDCAYASLGTTAHDALDDFYEGKIKYEDMINNFEYGWLTFIDTMRLKLDRNNEEHDEKVKAKYKECLEHFFRNHIVYKHKLLIEKPITAKIGGNAFIGYIDALYKDDDGVYNIVDFKTSSKYSGKSLEEHSGQLITYAIGMNQMGVPFSKIKCCFNFLKYATIQYEQANGKIKTRDVERCKIGQSIQSNAGMWLKKLGYENEADYYLKALLDTNDIKVLPESVRNKYELADCHVYIPLTQALVDKWSNDIICTICDIEAREADYKETNNDRVFWDDEQSVEKESFYFATLCGYSPKLHKPYGEFLDKLDAKNSGRDMFGGVGKEEEKNIIESNKVICHNNENEEPDLSWLDEIC